MSTTNRAARFASLVSLADASYLAFHKADKATAPTQELERLARLAYRAHLDVAQADAPAGLDGAHWVAAARKFQRMAAEYRQALAA